MAIQVSWVGIVKVALGIVTVRSAVNAPAFNVSSLASAVVPSNTTPLEVLTVSTLFVVVVPVTCKLPLTTTLVSSSVSPKVKVSSPVIALVTVFKSVRVNISPAISMVLPLCANVILSPPVNVTVSVAVIFSGVPESTLKFQFVVLVFAEVIVILSASVWVKVILLPAFNFISSVEDDAPVIVFLNIMLPVATGGFAPLSSSTKLSVVVFWVFVVVSVDEIVNLFSSVLVTVVAPEPTNSISSVVAPSCPAPVNLNFVVLAGMFILYVFCVFVLAV